MPSAGGWRTLATSLRTTASTAATGSSLGHFFRGLQGQDMAGIDDIGGQVLPQGEDSPALNPKGRPPQRGVLPLRTGAPWRPAPRPLSRARQATPCARFSATTDGRRASGWRSTWRTTFWCGGINYFVPHAFTGHPFPDPDCPPHFYAQGHNSQYRHFGKLLQAMNRVATVTSSGPHRVEAGGALPRGKRVVRPPGHGL